MWWLPLQAATPGPAGDPLSPTINKDGLPGGDALASLVGGLMYLGLLCCVAAVVVGAAMWGLGAHSGNYQGTYLGRRAVIGGFLGGLLIGAAVAIVNFAFGAGQGV